MAHRLSRRHFVRSVAAAGAAASVVAPRISFGDSVANPNNHAELLKRITDPDIRAGLTAAIEKNLLASISERLYAGQFSITADAGSYGSDSTWPGLDSWQMAGAYLLLGRTRLVLDYFDFVRASQRNDGNIPWAIFTGNTRPNDTWLSGLKYPEGSFTYTPPKREGLPASASEKREWVGMFGHWQPKATPLSNLASVCYVLTAAEIFEHTKDQQWLKERLGSIEAAVRWLLSRKTPENGLIAGSGFYTELPPRHGWDGVSQCYVAHTFRNMAKLLAASGDEAGQKRWTAEADTLAASFAKTFWRDDHFAEYVHFERGLVDSHGLSDTNWAAAGLGVATDAQMEKLWPRLTSEKAFWAGGIPTQTVTKPFSYEPWELHEKLSFGAPATKDVAAMGRVWYLEVKACERMRDTKRLVESTRLVCRAAKDGYWRERYIVQRDGKTVPAYADRYCEYAAVLIRAVMGNLALFTS
jgi:hypothetical protein